MQHYVPSKNKFEHAYHILFAEYQHCLVSRKLCSTRLTMDNKHCSRQVRFILSLSQKSELKMDRRRQEEHGEKLRVLPAFAYPFLILTFFNSTSFSASIFPILFYFEFTTFQFVLLFHSFYSCKLCTLPLLRFLFLYSISINVSCPATLAELPFSVIHC